MGRTPTCLSALLPPPHSPTCNNGEGNTTGRYPPFATRYGDQVAQNPTTGV